jgi:phage terminase large subunit-like protein
MSRRVRLTSPKPRKRVRVRLGNELAADELHDPVGDYANAVLRGDEVAGPHVSAACSRHIKDLEHAKDRGLTFDRKKANAVIGWFEKTLRLSGGQFDGIPFKLHPSQKFIVGSLFGWLREDGTRRFRRAYIEQGKGNGKSPLIAGIGLYGMVADSEPGAEIYAAGSSMDQSRVLFNDAVRMVEQAATLKKKVTVHGRKRVDKLSMPKGAFFVPLSRETRRRGSGPRPHMALCDEVHEYHDRMTIDLLERGFKSRRQPLLVMITNSGTDRNSVCYEEHVHAVKVARGDIEDDAAFSYVCALDEGDDPINDPSCWRKANPLLGAVISEEYLAGVTKQARDIPGKLNGILRLHFCVWTDSETAWISRQAWEACEDPTLNLEDFAGMRCFAGLDLGETKSLTGKALVFDDGYTDDGKPKFVAFVHGYTPKDTLHARAEADRAPYDIWVRDGHLTATPGPVIRNDYVARDLVQDSQRFDLAGVAYDQWLIKDFKGALGELGAVLPLLEHGQGFAQRRGCEPDCDKRHEHVPAPFWMPQSITDFETLILERRIRVHVNPALRSAVASARFLTSTAGLRRFEKQTPGGRIDLCVALTMAVGAAVRSTPSGTGYVDPNELLFA